MSDQIGWWRHGIHARKVRDREGVLANRELAARNRADTLSDLAWGMFFGVLAVASILGVAFAYVSFVAWLR